MLARIKPPPIDATQRWYRLDVADPVRSQFTLDPSMTVRRADSGDLHLLDQLPQDPAVSTYSERIGRERLGAGYVLWLTTEGGRVAFACWIFTGWTPIFGASGGGTRVPADAAVLDDSLASPDFRGRGVAPATWSAIAAELAKEGKSALYTKVDVTNVPSTRAVLKAGFRAVAEMRVVRRGRRFATTVHPGPGWSEMDLWLESLAHD